MKLTTIHFIRHGEVYNPQRVIYERLPDYHLSERGKRMAQATAEYVVNSPQYSTIGAIYCSPLDRTRETAQIILDAINEANEKRLVKSSSAISHIDDLQQPSHAHTPSNPDLHGKYFDGYQPLELQADERLLEAANEFRGRRVGFGEGALWKKGNWKLFSNIYKPSWGESYEEIIARMSSFAKEKALEHAGEQIIAVSHESPIWSYKHYLDTGKKYHNPLTRVIALASITSITYDCEAERVVAVSYVDPAAKVL